MYIYLTQFPVKSMDIYLYYSFVYDDDDHDDDDDDDHNDDDYEEDGRIIYSTKLSGSVM